MNNPLSKHFKPYFETKVKYKGGKSGIPKPGKKIYKMSSNENPLGTSSRVLNHLNTQIEKLYLYPDTTDTRLRLALEQYYHGKLNSDQFITANSGSEILQLLIKGMLNPGDEVIVSSPFFVPYRTFSEWAGTSVIDIPLVQPDYKLDVAGIIDAITDLTRMVYITSPNNPSGTYVNKTQFSALLSSIPKDVLVVYDEVYHHFMQEDDYALGLEYLSEYPNVIGLNSFSKAFGLASMRIGYMYADPEFASYIRLIHRPFLLNKLSMEAAIIALEDRTFIEEVAEHVQTELQFLHQGLTGLGINYVRSSANFIMFEPPSDSASFTKTMAEEGIILRPLDNYSAPGWVRVSIGTRAANLAFLDSIKANYK